MRHLFIAVIKLYRKIISPLTPPSCRFRPTCSMYAIQAFRRHGSVKGFALTIWRILRCNPYSKGGYDPIPPKKAPKRIKYPAGSKKEIKGLDYEFFK